MMKNTASCKKILNVLELSGIQCWIQSIKIFSNAKNVYHLRQDLLKDH